MKKLIILVCFFSIVGVAFALPLTLTNASGNKTVKEFTEKVEYTGEVLQLVFQPLLTYPNIALSSENEFKEFNEKNCLTPTQFKEVLNELNNNNYVVVGSESLISNSTPLIIPANKKPVILTFYDVSINKGLGKTEKVVLTSNGLLASETLISWATQPFLDQSNNDYIPILENFYIDEPNFFSGNIKGSIIINEENGVLGYQTQETNLETRQQELYKADVVKNKLIQNGWSFIDSVLFPENLTNNLNNLQTIHVKPTLLN